jgi:hypothetical protein
MDQAGMLEAILHSVQSIQKGYDHLSTTVAGIEGRVNTLTSIVEVSKTPLATPAHEVPKAVLPHRGTFGDEEILSTPPLSSPTGKSQVDGVTDDEAKAPVSPRKGTPTSRIILTTYPGQAGIDPIPMNWGSGNPVERGPIVVSRGISTVRRRNG